MLHYFVFFFPFICSWGPGGRCQQYHVCPKWEGCGEERGIVGCGRNQQVGDQQRPGQEVRASSGSRYCQRGLCTGWQGAAVLRLKSELWALCQWAALRQGRVPAGRQTHVLLLCTRHFEDQWTGCSQNQGCV